MLGKFQLALVSEIALIVAVLGSGVWLGHHFTKPETVTSIVHDTKQVEVKVPVLTEKVMDRIVTDPKQQVLINQLVKENRELKLRPTTITTTTVASAESGGTGGSDASKITNIPNTENGKTKSFQFKDFQLTAQYLSDGSKFEYKLDQKFNIVTSTAKDKDGKSVSLVNVFQTTPSGPKKLQAETTAISVTNDQAKWFVSPRIQAGFAMDTTKAKSGIGSFQWLKHGKSGDPKDIKVAVLSPGVVVGEVVKPALLPISINLGAIPKQPFSNLWVSPWIDTTKRIGFSVTATF